MNTYPENESERRNWINALLIASSTDELNIRVNEEFYLLPIIEKGVIVCLKIMLDDTFFMSEAVVHNLHAWIEQFSQEGPSKTVGDNIALSIIQFLACSVRLLYVNKLKMEAATYLL